LPKKVRAQTCRKGPESADQDKEQPGRNLKHVIAI